MGRLSNINFQPDTPQDLKDAQLTAALRDFDTTLEKQVFWSVQTGEATVPAADITGTTADTQEVVVTHNLGYIPVVIAFYETGSVQSPWSVGWQLFGSDANGTAITDLIFEQRTIRATDTTVTFRLRLEEITHDGASSSSASVGPYTVKYYLLRPTAN